MSWRNMDQMGKTHISSYAHHLLWSGHCPQCFRSRMFLNPSQQELTAPQSQTPSYLIFLKTDLSCSKTVRYQANTLIILTCYARENKYKYISFILLKVIILYRFSQQSIIQHHHEISSLNTSEGIAKPMDIFLH